MIKKYNKKYHIKEVKEFISYMIQYLDYGRIDFDEEWNKWYIYTPNSSFRVTQTNEGKFIVWREAEDGKFFKQEINDSITFSLFRCYFRDFCKEHKMRANLQTFTSFYRQFNSYLILKAVERMEIE